MRHVRRSRVKWWTNTLDLRSKCEHADAASHVFGPLTAALRVKINKGFHENNKSDHNIYQVYEKMYIFYSETSSI